MENKQPILSICIPTYNRCEILEENLANLIQLTEFNEEVEVIISDNASSDKTEMIARAYASKFYNIRYYRNNINVHDHNFELAMNRGSGHYIKLLNDRIKLTNDGLRYIKSKIKEHIVDRTPIFFTDDTIYTKKKAEMIVCTSLDEYIQSISTFVTLIGIFGAWKEQWENINNKSKYAHLLLSQIDWSYQIVLKGKGCVIYDKRVTLPVSVSLGVRSGYNWFKVHLDNYYMIMQPYIESSLITKATYKQDKKYLFKHFTPELINIYILIKKNKYFKFDTKHTFSYLWKYYKEEYYLYLVLLLYPIWWIYYNFICPLRKLIPKSLKYTLKKILQNNKFNEII